MLNCGGSLSRASVVLVSLKLGVGELGGFIGSGIRRLGFFALFFEFGVTFLVFVGVVVLGFFLGRG